MDEVFLVSENYVRSVTNIDDNVQSKYLQSAIREAQEVELQEVLGTNLLNKVKGLIADRSIELAVNAAYKDLVEQSQLFLAYQVITNVCVIAAVKISNGGLQVNYDENLNNVGLQDAFTLKDYYEKKADFFKSRLQAFIYEHRSDYPELSKNKCAEIQSTLYSAASTNLYLGGKRGKRS